MEQGGRLQEPLPELLGGPGSVDVLYSKPTAGERLVNNKELEEISINIFTMILIAVDRLALYGGVGDHPYEEGSTCDKAR